MLSTSWLLEGLLMVALFVPSLTVHEFAHAWVAYKLGDDTAARQGRLTLDPTVHVDPIGSLLAPLLHIPFGWARPVPVVASRFRRDVTMRTGILLTSIAGPLSNLLLAVACVVVVGVLARARVAPLDGGIAKVGRMLIEANVSLFLFNLLPIPPLDGSRVVDGLLPYRYRGPWERFQQYGWIALLVAFFFAGALLAWPLHRLEFALMRAIGWIAGF
jgi:Zn-dependent protease